MSDNSKEALIKQLAPGTWSIYAQHGRKIAEQMLEGTGITFDDILAHYKMDDIKS